MQRERCPTEPGDVVMWDNRSVLHRGRWFDLNERREMRRARTSDDVCSIGAPADKTPQAHRMLVGGCECPRGRCVAAPGGHSTKCSARKCRVTKCCVSVAQSKDTEFLRPLGDG